MAEASEIRVVAYRVFNLDASNMQPIAARRDWGGNLTLTQGNHSINIPVEAIPKFKRAVADMEELA